MLKHGEGKAGLLWIDLETTGLDPARCEILEVVAKVTDLNFTELAHFTAVIAQPEAVLTEAHPWALKQHTTSGLFDRVRESTTSEATVVKQFALFIGTYFDHEPIMLAGSSLRLDRNFIQKKWPSIEERLHYRMLDVSAWKVLLEAKYHMSFAKKLRHRAGSDIDESIAELRYYLNRLGLEPAE